MTLKLPAIEPKPIEKGEYIIGPFHHNPLFEVDAGQGQKFFVGSWEEAFSFLGSINLNEINHQYIVNYLFNNYEYTASPYKRIKRLPNNRKIYFDNDNHYKSSKYNPFIYQKKELTNKESIYNFAKDRFENCIELEINKYK